MCGWFICDAPKAWQQTQATSVMGKHKRLMVLSYTTLWEGGLREWIPWGKLYASHLSPTHVLASPGTAHHLSHPAHYSTQTSLLPEPCFQVNGCCFHSFLPTPQLLQCKRFSLTSSPPHATISSLGSVALIFFPLRFDLLWSVKFCVLCFGGVLSSVTG